MAELAAPELLSEIEAAVYEWTVSSDTLTWFPKPPPALSGRDLSSGQAWAASTDPDAMTSRHTAIFGSTARDEGEGVAYELEYPVRIDGRDGPRHVWIEDVGHWYAGADGLPARARGMIRVVTGRHEAEQRLAIQTRFDPLTGTLNRLKLLDVLESMLADGKRYRTSCSFLLLAVENIGALNEAYGDTTPDEIIAGVAKRLRSRMRTGDALGRFSTTIFGLALANCGLTELGVAARRFMDAVHEEPIETSAGPVGVRVTGAGIVGPRHAQSQVEMVARVSETLAEARRKRRGAFMPFAPSQARDDRRRRYVQLADELMAALNTNKVSLVFQPVVRARDGAVIWHEALARLEVAGDQASLSAHIEAAEKLGLVHLLDRRVLDLVVAALEANPHAVIAVNVSADTAVDPEWRDRVLHLLKVKPAIAGRLHVEITETAALGDFEETTEFVKTLREAGVQVAIDDFGAGQTSFRTLRGLGVDLVKIDGAFVRGLANSTEDRAFVRAIVELAREIGFETVAESVETEEIAKVLTELGASYLQGDFYGSPGPLLATG
ncbi:EAL domain-containing protein [Flaviflagellibacter deserti]|uniref:EAL domain-containing protein n=1 Tax=Flaviflagellibacter deserti TaxID=2267266 RepID=A0ABV9Z3T5_9HYPH